MCKKCPKEHHTLLHRDADSVPQEERPKTDDKVEETHVAAVTVNEQVLLMTCQVKVTAADESSTVARTLIDPGLQLPTFTNDLCNTFVYGARIRTYLSKDSLEVLHAHEVPHGSKCLA